MIGVVFFFTYLCIFSVVLGLFPVEWEERARLTGLGAESLYATKRKKKGIFALFAAVAMINKPLVRGNLRKRIQADLVVAHVDISPEEFVLMKEIFIVLLLVILVPVVSPDLTLFSALMSLVIGYMIPEFWLKGKIKKVKSVMMKELPDAIDLLGLCVNAGLDFMLALKWVVEKSPRSVMVDELAGVLQEINVGKPRREAIRDLANRYQLPDLSTFARTLIQADKMGTSVTEALNILSEDMRISRWRRGEQMALKAPLKMLVPLLFFIFPVVAILVAGPIFLDFIENNPFNSLTGATGGQ